MWGELCFCFFWRALLSDTPTQHRSYSAEDAFEIINMELIQYKNSQKLTVVSTTVNCWSFGTILVVFCERRMSLWICAQRKHVGEEEAAVVVFWTVLKILGSKVVPVTKNMPSCIIHRPWYRNHVSTNRVYVGITEHNNSSRTGMLM